MNNNENNEDTKNSIGKRAVNDVGSKIDEGFLMEHGFL